jgi:flagellar motility protein MotE (MotC chaperone)
MARIPRLLPLIAVAIGGVVAVRAVGAGPDLLSGARAWAEEATAEASAVAAPPRPAPAVCALTPEQLAQQVGVSPAELNILQSLMKRRTELDARDSDFASTLPLMAAAEQKLDAKIQALNALKGEINGLIGQVDAREKAETDRLVAVYSAMRPREAAAVFATLDDSVRLPVASAMRPRTLAAVMAQMQPAAARELTEKLARRYQAQQLAAKAAVASAAEPAPQPAASPAPPAADAPKPAAAAPAATPAPRRPAARQPARQQPTAAARPATAETAGPRPYQAGGQSQTPAAPASQAPRQSVQ